MNVKKLIFNILTAFTNTVAVGAYLFGYFEYGRGMLDLLRTALGLGGLSRTLGFKLLLMLLFFFIIPAFLALLNAGLGFALKRKGAGIFSIVTSSIGLFSVMMWGAFAGKSLYFYNLGLGAFINLAMFAGSLVFGILILTTAKDPVKQTPQNIAYQPQYNNGFVQPQVANNGYNNIPSYNDTDVTVKLDRDDGSFAQKSFPEGSVYCEKGKYRGVSFPIQDGERITIGRDPKQCNIILGEESIYVGRNHCNIVYFGEARRYEVTVSSSNGIILANGRRVKTGETVRLPAGTAIALGNNDNIFELR